MNLVVVESPSKANTIKKYLGKGFEVKASKGHVVDLPKSQLGIDVENDFKADYVVTNPKSLRELKAAYKNADKLILAVDLDREGEAIAWHVAQKLGAIDAKGNPKKGKLVERIVFSEISKPAIEEAIKHPRTINMDLVNAQQARRFLDRLVGYKLSPVLWKKIAFGLSAGRVQSAALRLVVERELERRKFNAEEYWSIDIYAVKDKKGNVTLKYHLKADDEEKEKITDLLKFSLFKYQSKELKVENQKDTDKILDIIKDKELLIKDVEKSVSKRYPKPPFITSTLQQSAINTLGFSAKKTMQIAQKLYEGGFITYMRTDSLSMSKDSIDAARKYVSKKYGDKYLPENAIAYKTKSKSAQEAHECIRPVDFKIEDIGPKFDNDFHKLYNLIKNRTLASQMNPALVENMSVYSDIEDYNFKATGMRIVFDGFLRLNPERTNEVILPEIQKGEVYYQDTIFADQHFTQPPARYSEASLVKKLEELGIGRPSTYASIISTILSRKYVIKEGRYLSPTDVGEVVNSLLVKYFSDVVDYSFTSGIEDELDKVAEGNLEWLKMLREFYMPFAKNVETNEKNITREEFTTMGDAPEKIKCPDCGSKMLIKLGRYGKFYSCSKYPECKGILSLDEKTKEDMQKEAVSEEFLSTYKPSPKTDDGRDYILKNGKFGKFWAHPDYPKVKDIKSLEYVPEKVTELFGETPKTDKGKDYLLRSGKFGYFWAHPDYPKVKDIIRIKKK